MVYVIPIQRIKDMKVLVTGPTGYVGGRLIPRLIEKGYSVSVLTRKKDHIIGLPWARKLNSIIEGDCLEASGLWAKKLKRFDVIYYLIHSMNKDNFFELDQTCARNFARAAKDVKHLIYLGGLLPETKKISKHLQSRALTGQNLSQLLPTTEFRAGPIIGSGSLPFEMVRYLTERIPLMITPKWIRNRVQPIAIRDVLNYLIQAAEMEPMGVVDIGSNKLTFKAMMEQYAKTRCLKRYIIALPVLTPWLAARWVGLVTPISTRLASPLIEGIMHPVVGKTTKAKQLFPGIKPISYKKAISYALKKIEKSLVETHWSATSINDNNYKLKDWEGMVQEQQVGYTKANPKEVFKAFSSIGGKNGWMTWNWAWQIRGWVDKLLGGPGLGRGRRSPEKLFQGEVVDFWRVEKITDAQELLLRAEMKLPGKAWLRFHVLPYNKGSILVQTAFFEPYGFWGFFYWYLMYPAHKIIFPGMVKNILKKAEKEHD